MKFGFFLRKNNFEYGDDIKIEPLEDFQSIVDKVMNSGMLSEGWIYPPLEPAPLTQDEKSFNQPLIYSPTFTLPETHETKIKKSTQKLQEQMISAFGFMNGLRLVPSGWCSFYRTAYKMGKLVDFTCLVKDEEKLVDAFYTFFKSHTDDLNKQFFAAIHWFLFNQSYMHSFEIFDAQYKVTDTLSAILSKLKCRSKPPKHPERIQFLSDELGVPLPDWAKGGNKSVLAELRNYFVHETIYAGEPIGFSFPDINIPDQLTYLNSRFIVAMTGSDCEYIHTKCDIRGHFAIDMRS